MFTGEDKKVRWGRVVAFIILGALGAYLLLFSLIRVPPHTVIAVKVPGGIRPYVNESDKMVLRWRWPYIYKVVGYREETIKLQEFYEIKAGDTLEKIVEFYKLDPVEFLKIASIVLEDEEKNKEFQELVGSKDYGLAYEKIKTLALVKESRIPVPAVKEKTTSFALYTVDEVSGKVEDKTKARAYFIDVKFKVDDWDKYLVEIDLDEINKARKQAGPWYPLMKDRVEVVTEPIKNMIRSGGSTDRFGKPLKTEEGRPAMDLTTKMGYFENELTSRRNIVICVIDAYGLKTAEEIKKHLKGKEPWMYFAGVSTFEQLANQHKEIQEYTMSQLIKGLTWEGGQERFVFGTDQLELFAKAYQAYEYQDFLMEAKAKLEDIALQRKDFQGKVDKALYSQSEVVVKSFKDWARMNGGDIKFIQNLEQLSQNYQMFGGEIESNIVLAFMRAEVEAIKKQLIEAEKKYIESPLEKEEELKAKEFVQGLLKSLKDQANREIWQLTSQGVKQAFDYYLANYLANLAKSGESLPERTKQYFYIRVGKAYMEALEEKVIEAEKFLGEIKIAKEFYRDIEAKLQGQKVDMSQLMQDYFTGKQELFQTAAYLVNLSWQEESISWQKVQWQREVEETLIPFFKEYSISNDDLPMTIRRITAEENEALWDAAIANVLEGEDISQYSSHWVHQVKKGETLAQIIKKYGVSWQSLFGPTPRQTVVSMVFRSLEEKRFAGFNRLVAKAMENGDYSEIYEFAKDVPLKPAPSRLGDIILINKVEKEYSHEWFELEKVNREKREKIIKRYFWPWVEKFAPEVIEEYLYSPNSPWLDYIENTYGVKILEVKLRVEDDEMFDKSGAVKPEYYDIYLSKAEEWKLGEGEKEEE